MGLYFNTNSISPSKGGSGGGVTPSAQITATNFTGSPITSNDKVYINDFYHSAGTYKNIDIPMSSNSVFTTDGNYIIYSSSARDIETNTTYTIASSSVNIGFSFKNGIMGCYIGSSTDFKSWYLFKGGKVKFLGKAIPIITPTSDVYYYYTNTGKILHLDEDFNLIGISTETFSFTDKNCYMGFYVNGKLYIMSAIYTYTVIEIDDLITGTIINQTNTSISTGNLLIFMRSYIFSFTSDGKYLFSNLENKAIKLTKPGTVINFDGIPSNYLWYNGCDYGNYIGMKSAATEPNIIYTCKYDPETETIITIPYDSSQFTGLYNNLVGPIFNDGSKIIASYNRANNNYSFRIMYLTEYSGKSLINYNAISRDTITGIAAENISAGNSGLINVASEV